MILHIPFLFLSLALPGSSSGLDDSYEMRQYDSKQMHIGLQVDVYKHDPRRFLVLLELLLNRLAHLYAYINYSGDYDSHFFVTGDTYDETGSHIKSLQYDISDFSNSTPLIHEYISLYNDPNANAVRNFTMHSHAMPCIYCRIRVEPPLDQEAPEAWMQRVQTIGRNVTTGSPQRHYATALVLPSLYNYTEVQLFGAVLFYVHHSYDEPYWTVAGEDQQTTMDQFVGNLAQQLKSTFEHQLQQCDFHWRFVKDAPCQYFTAGRLRKCGRVVTIHPKNANMTYLCRQPLPHQDRTEHMVCRDRNNQNDLQECDMWCLSASTGCNASGCGARGYARLPNDSIARDDFKYKYCPEYVVCNNEPCPEGVQQTTIVWILIACAVVGVLIAVAAALLFRWLRRRKSASGKSDESTQKAGSADVKADNVVPGKTSVSMEGVEGVAKLVAVAQESKVL